MCTHKANQYVADGKLNQHNQPVVIALYVEDIALISHTIHAVECGLYVGKTLPIRLLRLIIPIFESNL